MVRAAGLYPAGSRFESWLPYHMTGRHSVTHGPARCLASDERPELLNELVAPVGCQRTRRRQ